ncbi:hypothetical protein GCM10009596_19170 [Arthrobacter rhombi]|uniref:C40 family peptidase n=1 Tax=Arthrobacter rhombi TaxID=71253 RepID=UPI0031D014C1
MTKRQALGRHRAMPVRTNPLGSISKAVSSNAGSVGRQAAVIAAASGLVLTLGVPAQATTAARAADKAPVTDIQRASVATPASVTVPATKKAADSIRIAVAPIKSTDGSAHRAAVAEAKAKDKAEREAAAERRQAAQDAAAEREAAQEAASNRQEAAAPQASTSRSTSNSASTSSTPQRSSSSASTSSSNVTTASAGTVTKTAEAAPAAVSGGNSSIASMAKSYLGTPYVFGGSTPGGWDCSGFVQYVYGKAGVSLPHNARAQRASGKFVRTSNPQPGDLVFQSNDSHVGIYIGGGKMIGAQNPSVGTVVRDTTGPYAAPLVGYYTLAR